MSSGYGLLQRENEILNQKVDVVFGSCFLIDA